MLLEGLGHFPASKISIVGTAENRDFYGKGTPGRRDGGAPGPAHRRGARV